MNPRRQGSPLANDRSRTRNRSCSRSSALRGAHLAGSTDGRRCVDARLPVSAALLIAGYTVAVAVLLRAGAVLRERRWRWFLALELATATVAAGYAVAGVRVWVVLNGTSVVLFAVVWWRTGSRLGHQRKR